MGVSLHGAPAILIGFNRNLAWSHTVSTAYRFTIYELTLAQGDPTSYLYGTEIRPMEATEYTIDVKEDNGQISQLSRTLYRSHHGPIMNLHISNGAGPFNWTNRKRLCNPRCERRKHPHDGAFLPLEYRAVAGRI